MNFFRISEFFYNCTSEEKLLALSRKDVSDHLCRWFYYINDIRVELGKPIIITSGYRDTQHNARVGGVATSHHLTLNAIDIKCSDNLALYRIISKYSNIFGKCYAYVDTGKPLELSNIRFFHISLACENNNFALSYKRFKS